MNHKQSNKGIELTAIPWLRRLLTSRWPQWMTVTGFLAVFIYSIAAGFLGTEVGSRNLAITLIWIAWWGLLILILVPLGGRFWCSVCPIPAPGEMLQRGGVLQPDGRHPRGLGIRWPRRFRNLWLQNIGFLSLAIFSAVILTQPKISAAVLLVLLALALGISAVFERRSFCRYLCPVGGFIGIYSLLSPLALRVKDPEVCRTHPTKDCYRGNEHGHGCPWMTYPGTLDRNAECGLCMECLRTCPLDNVSLIIRTSGTDLTPKTQRPPLRMDEAFKGFIMLAAALLYSIVLLGPWGEFKLAAFNVGSLPWLAYAGALLLLSLIILPALYLMGSGVSHLLSPDKSISLRNRFIHSTTGLVPLGLGAWVAFSLSLFLINGSYIPITLSDPLGWGWNLLGTASTSWTPMISGWIPTLQSIVLFVGLASATSISVKSLKGSTTLSTRSLLAMTPTLLVNASMTGFLLWVLV
ncbi:MAG: 4Fe-4S binding protein [Anaerolineales bacterium]|nr:4Fe-4S binding protein [Anaerolineales bacterium]